jgi:hypothetical protein
VNASRSSGAAGSAAGRSRIAAPVWARAASPRVADHRPHHVGALAHPARGHRALEELLEQRLVLGENAVLGVEGEVARDVPPPLDDLVAQDGLAGDEVVDEGDAP